MTTPPPSADRAPLPAGPTPAGPPPAGPPAAVRAGRWYSLRLRGLGAVLTLELRQRIRSVKWYVALGLWAVFLLGMMVLLFGASSLLGVSTMDDLRHVGSIVFTAVVFLVIFALLLVLPALSAGSINGDRSAGTLATLQSTMLSPLEIVLGKILAGWVLGLAFIALSLPSLLPSALISGAGIFYIVRVVAALSVLALFITMIGIGLSALTSRQLGSVVLSYLLVLGATVILPILYAVSLPFLSYEQDVQVWTSATEDHACVQTTRTREIVRTDVTLPLLVVNPFVIVSDVSPAMTTQEFEDSEEPGHRFPDGLQGIRLGVRHLAQPLHPSHFNRCWDPSATGYPADLGTPQSVPMWPFGLAAWGIVGLGGAAVAVWRLRAPMRYVPKGTRIA